MVVGRHARLHQGSVNCLINWGKLWIEAREEHSSPLHVSANFLRLSNLSASAPMPTRPRRPLAPQKRPMRGQMEGAALASAVRAPQPAAPEIRRSPLLALFTLFTKPNSWSITCSKNARRAGARRALPLKLPRVPLCITSHVLRDAR